MFSTERVWCNISKKCVRFRRIWGERKNLRWNFREMAKLGKASDNDQSCSEWPFWYDLFKNCFTGFVRNKVNDFKCTYVLSEKKAWLHCNGLSIFGARVILQFNIDIWSFKKHLCEHTYSFLVHKKIAMHSTLNFREDWKSDFDRQCFPFDD